MTETLLSELAHANIGPSSNGAQATEFTLAACKPCSLMTSHRSPRAPAAVAVAFEADEGGAPSAALPFSFQMNTLPSYEAEARIGPKEGWAQESCQIGAVWLRRQEMGSAPAKKKEKRKRKTGRNDGDAHPRRMSGSPFGSPSWTSKTRMVLSEEQVASRLP